MADTNDGASSWHETARQFRKAAPSSAALNSASPVAVVLNFWREFDLESARGKLDDQGLKIAEHQENSLKNRRKLAETTRDFKKASNDDKVTMFGPLLKTYQEEVDNLTKRAKFSENAFLNVYQKLYEAPDPVPALATGADTSARLGDLETENRKFRQELEEFRAESAHLKNQQATVRRLEERNRQLEQQMEEKVKELVEVRQKVLAEESQKNLELLRERENALYEQLRAARESVRTMQQLQESTQNQLFEYKAQSDEEKAAKQSELNLLTDEVDRAQQRLLSIEKEKELLKAQVIHVQDREPQHSLESFESDTSSSSLEASLSAKEKIISELHGELHGLETTLSTEREAHVAELRKIHSEIDEKEALIAGLQTELLARPTAKQLDDLKKQVKILQAVGYNSIEAQDWEVAARGEEIGKLESLLLDKNRKMEHELTQLKVQLGEKTAEVDAAKVRIMEMSKETQNQKILIAKLEEDILRGYSSGAKGSLRSDDWEASEVGLNSLVQSRDAAEEEENSMLTVVCGQRDRFRQRLTEAEEELRQAKDKCRVLQDDLKRKEADNVKLYERIRYVSEYGKDRGPTGRSMKKRGDDLEAGSGSDADLLRYKKMYEDDINPFAAFTKKEKEQRYRELGLRDKITLTSALFFLGNRYGRMFLFFYSIFLHFLVFAAMYRLSANSRYARLASYKHDSLPSAHGRLNPQDDLSSIALDLALNSTIAE